MSKFEEYWEYTAGNIDQALRLNQPPVKNRINCTEAITR